MARVVLNFFTMSLSLYKLSFSPAVVQKLESAVETDASPGSFDCVRLAPRFAQDDNLGMVTSA